MTARERLTIAVGIVIVLLWGVSVLLSFIDRSYNPPATLHALMMLVAGVLFGPTITGGRGRR